jgi:hypothetical protein
MYFVDNIIRFTESETNNFSKISSFDPNETLFISSDRFLRHRASKNGYLTTSHISIAKLILSSESIHFVKAIGNKKQLETVDELVPYYLEHLDSTECLTLCVMSKKAIDNLVSQRVKVDILSVDLQLDDFLFVNLDKLEKESIKKFEKLKIVYSDGQRILVAINSSKNIDSIEFHESHGHFLYLQPDDLLLKPTYKTELTSFGSSLPFLDWPENIKIEPISPMQGFSHRINNPLPTIQEFEYCINKYSGESDIDSSGKIISRHSLHNDNKRAVLSLINELNSMGYNAYTHSFEFEGKTLQNVIADLPGIGYWKTEPNIREEIRQNFFNSSTDFESDKEVIKNIVGNKWFKDKEFDTKSSFEIRHELEKVFKLNYYNWWVKDQPLSGINSEIIIIGCHMDSTASSEPGYNPLSDPAPGKDDDGSGVAGTLLLAKYLSQFRGQFTHTIRFCFFNTEEQGLVGSLAYAKMLKNLGAPIKAAICMDMIGYNNDEKKLFEIHCGSTNREMRDKSLPFANLISSWAMELGNLSPAQIYKGTQKPTNSSHINRDIYDGGIERSDHSSFHIYGYPAIVISEDIFVNLSNEPIKDSNPNYHSSRDKIIDSNFATEITKSVALTVRQLALGEVVGF